MCLQHPCVLGASRRVEKIRSGHITLAFSQGTSGQNRYVTPTLSRVPKGVDKIRSDHITPTFSGAHNWAELLCNPCVLGGPLKRGQNQKWPHHPYLLGGPQMGDFATLPLRSHGPLEKGTKSETATSPLPSQGPTIGQNCYATLAFSGVPWRGDKIRSGYITPAFSGAHKWAEVLHNPCVLRGCQNRAAKSEVATSPLPSRGPTSGQNCYVILAFLGVANKGEKIRSDYITLALSGAQKWAELLRHPCVLGGPQKRGQNQKWLHHPCLLGVGGIAMQSLRSWGSPTKVTKSEVATSPLPYRGATSGRNCCITPAFSQLGRIAM